MICRFHHNKRCFPLEADSKKYWWPKASFCFFFILATPLFPQTTKCLSLHCQPLLRPVPLSYRLVQVRTSKAAFCHVMDSQEGAGATVLPGGGADPGKYLPKFTHPPLFWCGKPLIGRVFKATVVLIWAINASSSIKPTLSWLTVWEALASKKRKKKVVFFFSVITPT